MSVQPLDVLRVHQDQLLEVAFEDVPHRAPVLACGFHRDLGDFTVLQPRPELATEIIRGAWRLRRCAIVEATLATLARTENLKVHEERHEQMNGKDVPYRGTCDPMIYDCTSGTQVAVDRARTQARRHAPSHGRAAPSPTERLFRIAALPENADSSRFGLASFDEVLPRLQNEAKAQLFAAITPSVEEHPAPSRASGSPKEKLQIKPNRPLNRPHPAAALIEFRRTP